MKRAGQQLKDDDLSEISGGFYDDKLEGKGECACGSNRPGIDADYLTVTTNGHLR